MKKVLFIATIISLPLIAQAQNNEIIKKQFSFGRFWNWPENIVYVDQPSMLKQGIVYRDTEFFMQKMAIDFRNSNLMIDSLLKDKSIKLVQFSHGKFDLGSFFLELKDFNDIRKKIYIRSCDILNCYGTIPTNIESSISISGSKLLYGFWINRFNFKSYFEINNSLIDNQFEINSSIFKERFSFNYDTIKCNFVIRQTTFSSTFDMSNSVFIKKPEFEIINFSKEISFYNCDFKEGADFRRSNFDSLNAIYLEGCEFPDGKLFITWEEIKSNGFPKIRLKEVTNNQEDNYHKLVSVYEKLRDNYLYQGNKKDADNVMYELADYKRILLNSFWQNLYFFFLGYGYEPWRYLVLWAILITVFSVIWYFGYYGLIVNIIYPNLNKEMGLMNNEQIVFPTKEKRIFSKKSLLIYDNKNIEPFIGRIVRIWHVVHFSTSVLLSIRFKKEWITDRRDRNILGIKSFLCLVTFEWLIGIISYLIFAYFVLSNQYSYIKGLFGF